MAVVVGAIGGQHRQAVGVMVSTHQMVAGSLAGGVRAVRFVAMSFAERRFIFSQRAIYFVCGNMQEAKPCLFSSSQTDQ